MKLFISFLIICVTSLLGVNYVKRLHRKVIYYDNLIDFINNFIYELSFAQTLTNDIIKKYRYKYQDDFILTLNNFINEEKIKNLLLSKDENLMINDFFSNIGKSDLSTQLNILSSFKEKFLNWYDNIKKKEDKEGKIVIKLAFLLGVGISILII